MVVPSIQQNGDDGPPRKQRCRMSSFVGSPPQLTILHFLKLGYRRMHRDNKVAPGGVLCYYLNSGSNHPLMP